MGEADDELPADGNRVLSWKDAFAKAMKWVELYKNGNVVLDLDVTVTKAVNQYILKRDARRAAQAGRAVRSDASYKLTRHVLEDRKIASVLLRDLTEGDLLGWQRRLAKQHASSVQRIANDLKAALNAAGVEYRKMLPGDFPITIKHGLSVEAPTTTKSPARENQILSDDQVRSIVITAMAIDEDFGRLVLFLAATGARFAQVRRMVVADVQLEQARVMIPQSFKGKKKECQYIRVAVGQDVLGVLRQATDGRPADAPLFERWFVRQVNVVTWERYARGPWSIPTEMTRNWKKAIAAAGLGPTTIPYALRHSSIVRGLRQNLPIRLVAALHDTSVAMIERHYARWITDGLDDMVARAVVPMFENA
ncbi:MAG: tyrosine-type recombinase/integrase [bacterium]|nr:tyrosine-type recombinase/integrase [bacterium]